MISQTTISPPRGDPHDNPEQRSTAGGQRWCTEEAVYNDVVGVTKVGRLYRRQRTRRPTYEARVCSGTTGHTEAIRVTYDSTTRSAMAACSTSSSRRTIRPQLNRQGNDIGTQYRSAAFPQTPEEEAEVRAAIERAQPVGPRRS